MRLLITVQKVDQEDSVLGFFHRWIVEFAKHYEKVTVIALEVGSYSLPQNVEVLSLGKETKKSRIRYIEQFYTYIFNKQGEYDAVFVHMNPEYIVLGGIFWRLWGKRIGLWYNHKVGGIRARIAAFFSDIIFYVSPYAFMERFKKAKQMGAGIDTEIFKNQGLRIKNKGPLKILSLGRISPVKDVSTIVEALSTLDSKGISFEASIYGDPTDHDNSYYKKIREIARPLEERGILAFYNGIPNRDTPVVYNKHDIFINMTPSGSFDKTILEAMASEMIVLTCNRSFESILPKEFLVQEKDSNDLAEKLSHALHLTEGERDNLGKELRRAVIPFHDLKETIKSVTSALS